MGRSPVFSTLKVTVSRPALSSISPGAAITSPGIMLTSRDRLVHSDQLRPVRESRLDLYLGNHLRNSLHHLVARQNRLALAHEFGHRLAVARSFDDGGRDQCNRLRIVELQAAGPAPLGDQRCREDE